MNDEKERFKKRLEESKYAGYTFTDDQKEAIQLITKWYNDDTKLTFSLSGEAGTGKTYLVKYLLQRVIKTTVCVTAPTHKAVRVLEHMTGVKGKTIQSLHGLRPDFSFESFNIDDLKYKSLGNIYIKNYNIVIMDESSMVSKELYELNELRSKQYHTKILYIGDPYQLPPVNEQESETFNCKDRFRLTTIVRQEEDNPLIKLLGIVRKDVEHGTSEFIKYIRKTPRQINDKGNGYEVLGKLDFSREVNKYFSSVEFENNVNYCRYTAYTNRSILDWNNYIRHTIIPDTSEIISKDDLLTGYITLVDEFNNLSIINSEDYIIGNIFKRVTEDGFNSFVVELVQVSQEKGKAIVKTTVNIVDHKSPKFVNYYDRLNILHFNAVYSTAAERGKNWSQLYYPYKNKNLVLNTFPLKDTDGDIRGWVKKDLDYGYGLTVHKLQGTTINNIFVNLLDLCYKNGNYKFPRKDIKTRNKLIYTALSRASDKAIILF